MADYQHVSREKDDGALIGAASTSKIGFLGATPTTQQSLTALTTTSSTVASSVSVAVAEIQTVLATFGLCSAAA